MLHLIHGFVGYEDLFRIEYARFDDYWKVRFAPAEKFSPSAYSK